MTLIEGGILDQPLVNAIRQVDENYKQAKWSIRRKEPLDKVWPYWGPFFIDAKFVVEDTIRQFSVPHLCWFYGYMQNRNQLLSLHCKSRVGKMGRKKDLEKSSKIIARLIRGELQPKSIPDEIMKKVNGHISQLYTAGKYDIIIERPIAVKDYRGFVSPFILKQMKKPVEESQPAQYIATKDTLVLED